MAIILPANSAADTGYSIDNSCRFAGDAYLTKTPGSAGSGTTGTFSWWMKYDVAADSSGQYIWHSGGTPEFGIRFHNKALKVFHHNGSSYDFQKATSMLFRDPSAWYHICIKIDTTNGTAANRLKLFVNGTATAWGATDDTVAEDFSGRWFVDAVSAIASVTSAGAYYKGYLAEFVGIDGTAYNADSFGEFDDDSPTIWKPIDVSGLTFGTNGFYLDFEDSANLGNDANGGTDWSETSLAATDQASDSPTNNFATLNPLYQQGDNAFSEGNCKVVLEAGDGTKGVASNIAVSSGKWYFEVKQGSSTNSVIQVREASDKEDDLSYYQGSYAGYQFSNGNQYITGNSSSGYGASYADGDIIMVALDMDNDRVYFGKNGSWNDGDGNADEANLNDYVPVNGVTNAIAAFTNANGSATATAEFNFGNPPFSISSGNSDANGYGNFEYAVPSGYYALCTKNLAEFG